MVLEQQSVVEVPAWAQWPWLRAGFSTRQGGVSRAYSEGEAELNLGWTKEDAAEAVTENRRLLISAVAGSEPGELVTMRQVHGAVVRTVSRNGLPLATPEGRVVLECDGLATGEPGVLLGVQTADCTPILLVDSRTRAVAALHAGWRGTLAGIAGEGVRVLQRDFGARPAEIRAAIGPAILPCCFAVGEEVREAFTRQYSYGAELFMRDADGQLRMDLHATNRRQLLEAGLLPESIATISECSACMRLADGRRRYFSHRAEHGVTGRMMSVIGIVTS